MEPLFECRYRMDEALFRRLVRVSWLRPRMLLLAVAVPAAILVAGLWKVAVRNDPTWLVVGLVPLAFYAWNYLRLPRRLARNRLRAKGGILPEVVVTGDAQGVTVREGAAEVRYAWAQVKRFRRGGGLGMLMLTERTAVLLPDDGFVAGGPERIAERVNDNK